MKALSKVNISNKDHYIDGKTKDNFLLGKDKILFVFTDRISANDVLLAEAVPQKGKISCRLSKFWFDFLETRKIIPTHFLGETDIGELNGTVVWQDGGKTIFQNIKEVSGNEIESRVMVVKRIDKIIPLRFIVKGYATETRDDPIFGKTWKSGIRFLVPFTEILARTETENGVVYIGKAGLILDKWMKKNDMESDPELIKFFVSLAAGIYGECQKASEGKGVIIAEAKFQFGFDSDGKLVLVDEILNPDCARFWLKEDYEAGQFDSFYDKRILIGWLKQNWFFGKTPPPKLPEELIEKISGRYDTILKRIVPK